MVALRPHESLVEVSAPSFVAVGISGAWRAGMRPQVRMSAISGDRLPREVPRVKSRIVIVDDEPLMLESLRRTLRAQAHCWDIRFISSSLDAWEHLQQHAADVLLTDLSMPVMSGLELVRRLRGHDATRDIPIVVLTGSNDIHQKSEALDCGATDLLNKPVHPMDLMARLRNALRLKSYQDELKLRNEELEVRVQERTQQLQASRREIIWRLSRAAEFRDEATGNHVVRVAEFSRVLALVIGESLEFAETLFLAAPLHDVGKIGISDLILLKPGPLTDHERQVMQTHCEIGERILQADCHCERNRLAIKAAMVQERSRYEPDPVLRMAQEIAACPPEQALKIMQLQRGLQFDPRVFDGFLQAWPQIESIRESLDETAAVERMDSSTLQIPSTRDRVPAEMLA
jgi:putative two-component system response regulator